MSRNAKEMTKKIVAALDEKKAEEIRIIDISEVSIMADYFVIAHGNNRNQVHALIDNVEEKLSKEDGIMPKQTEGYRNANWVLMDYGDVIVHVFDKENRLFYDLERIWKDGKNVEADEFRD